MNSNNWKKCIYQICNNFHAIVVLITSITFGLSDQFHRLLCTLEIALASKFVKVKYLYKIYLTSNSLCILSCSPFSVSYTYSHTHTHTYMHTHTRTLRTHTNTRTHKAHSQMHFTHVRAWVSFE